MLSFFKLAGDVQANFILFDPIKRSIVYDDHEGLLSQVNQPVGNSVFNQTALVVTTPTQDVNVLRRIRARGLKLHLSAFRPSDKMMSHNSFEFTYLEHDENGTECRLCRVFHHHAQASSMLPQAKPGVARRSATDSGPVDAPKQILQQYERLMNNHQEQQQEEKSTNNLLQENNNQKLPPLPKLTKRPEPTSPPSRPIMPQRPFSDLIDEPLMKRTKTEIESSNNYF